MGNITINMSPSETLKLESQLRERISEGLCALSRTRFHPCILETNQANLTAGQTTEIVERLLRLPGTGPYLLKGIQWYSNTARNTLPGTIGQNEKRWLSLRITNAADKDPLMRMLGIAGTFFGYKTARWDAPCGYVTDPGAGFKIEVNDDGITANQDVFFSIHGEIAEGISRPLFEECVNMGLVDRVTPPAVLDLLAGGGNHTTKAGWDYRALRAYLLNKVRCARLAPYATPTFNNNIPASTTTRMTDDDFRMLRGPVVLKRLHVYFDIATRNEATGVISNDFIDRVDLNIYDVAHPETPFMLNPVMAGLVVRFDTNIWELSTPYVQVPNEALHIDLVEQVSVATTDCFAAFHGYSVTGMNSAEVRAALRLGLLS